MLTQPTRTRLVFSLTAVALLAAGAASARSSDGVHPRKAGWPNRAALATLVGGNGIYTVHIDDATGFDCGAWTATTGLLHPAGPGQNVLFGNGFPGTSNTTFRSYSSGTDYVTSNSFCSSSLTAVDICSVAAPVVAPLMNGAVTTGYKLTWTFNDPGVGDLKFIQEVNVEGPVDGTENVDNTVIRETHTVLNAGTGSLFMGLRKHWDWEIGNDDGPWIGDCDTPDLACDRSINFLAGDYPAAYTINEDPAAGALCPLGIPPLNPAGCGGAPLYLVAGTTSGPSQLVPEPTAPELFQFNSWGSLISDCWEPGLTDNATCAGGDTAAAYFYGRTAGSAELVFPGEERSFTQYVVAAADECPDVIDPCPPTPPGSPGSPASPNSACPPTSPTSASTFDNRATSGASTASRSR